MASDNAWVRDSNGNITGVVVDGKHRDVRMNDSDRAASKSRTEKK